MKKFFNRYFIFVIFYGILLLIVLLPFYRNGFLILGGEGNYWLDFSVHLKNYTFAWQNKGLGDYNPSPNANFPLVLFFTLIQSLVNNVAIVNFLLIFLIYWLPFLGMMVLCRELKRPPFVAFLTSFFYLVNPFSLMFLASLNQWNVLVLFSMPLFFWVVLKFYPSDFELFFFYGLVSLFLASTNVNPPLIAINLITTIIAVLFAEFYLFKKISLIRLVKKGLLLAISFFLFNLWWLLSWVYLLVDVQKAYTKQFAISWLSGVADFVPVTFRTFNLTPLLLDKVDRTYNFFNYYYTSPLVLVILPLPIFILLYAFFRRKIESKPLLCLTFCLFATAFLIKGLHGFFGFLYELAVLNLPFFSIFKTATEKWGVLYVFLLALLLAFTLGKLKKDRWQKAIRVLFFLYLFICFIPLITGGFIPDYRINKIIKVARKYFDKKEYQQLRKELNQEEGEYRVLTLPGGGNYQVALQIDEETFYTGNDPLFNNQEKAYLAPYNHNNQASVLYETLSQPSFFALLGFFNVKKIVYNQDALPWFGFQEKENYFQVEAILDKQLKATKNETIDLYDVGENYVPRFYLPQKLIFAPSFSQKDWPLFGKGLDFSLGTSAFCLDRYEGGEKLNLVQELASEIVALGENQSAVIESRLREGVRGMNQSGVFFPYARWKPGSLLYPLIQKKEAKAKQAVANNLELLIEQNLFFASKRIFEIQRWEREFNNEQYQQELENYKQEMTAAVESLDKLTSENKDTFLLLAKIEVAFGAHQERLLNILKGNYADENHERLVWARESLQIIDKQLKDLIEKYFFYPKYYFEIPEEGEYEILLENNAVPTGWQIAQKMGEKGEEIFQEISRDENWISFGKKRFGQEKLYLTILKTPSNNLIADSWQKSEITSSDEALSIQGRGGFLYQEINDWQPETDYRISLNFKTFQGRFRIYLVEDLFEKKELRWLNLGLAKQVDEKAGILLSKTLESKNEWQSFSTVVKSSREGVAARLYLVSNETDEAVQIEIKNAQVEAVIQPKMILKKTKANNYSQLPEISFQKINPTKYVVEVKNALNPYFLVFSESFHRGWRVYLEEAAEEKDPIEVVGQYLNGQVEEKKTKTGFFDRNFFQTWLKKPLDDEKHLLLNGYANAWYLAPEDAQGKVNYRLIIEYWPQKLLYGGILVTMIVLLISTVLFWRLIFKRKAKK